MMKRSHDHPRLLRPQGNRASLQRHSKAQVALVRNGSVHDQAQLATPAEIKPPIAAAPAGKRWRRRSNTY